MVCAPCQKRKQKLLEQARTQNPSVFFKGNADSNQIKIHGRVPIRCEAKEKWCVMAVYLKCNKVDCHLGTPRFDEILQEYDKEQVDKTEI